MTAVLLGGMLTALCLALSAAENQQLGSRSHQLAMWTNSWAVDNTLRNASHQQVGGGGLCICPAVGPAFCSQHQEHGLPGLMAQTYGYITVNIYAL